MLSGEGNEHEVQDDLESCYWVLLYIAFHYFEHNSPDFDLSFFSEYIAPKDRKPASGGRLKTRFLQHLPLETGRMVLRSPELGY